MTSSMALEEANGACLMKGPVAKLSEEDMVSIAAYLASRKP